MGSHDAIATLKSGGHGAAKVKSAGAAVGKLGAASAPVPTLVGGTVKAAPASTVIGKLSLPYIHLNGLSTGANLSSSGIASSTKLVASLFSGKGLSLGFGLGLGSCGSILIAGAICAVGYGAYRVYKDNPKIRSHRVARAGNAEDDFVAQVSSFAEDIYDSGVDAFKTLIAPADKEAALAAKLAAEAALAEKLVAEANTAEKRSLAAGNSAKQAARMAAAAKLRAKAALDALHSTEAQMTSVLASKRRANPAGSKP